MSEKTVRKPKQKEFTSSQGNKYVLQTVPNSKYLEIMDESVVKDNGQPSISILYPKLLEHVVVQPNGLKVDDFDDFSELREVCEAALKFQQS
ncbi:hypothetical protein ACFQ38_16185 [Sporosarcina contaminans]|uniref:Uncharacterized protein n=1 Tax=Sporosarcina contaminans TaxID=633403 RepID=A0ABW3U0N0_9BACL